MNPSTVSLQLLANEADQLDKILDLIEDECEKNDVEISQGTGPSYEFTVPKLIHQDRVR